LKKQIKWVNCKEESHSYLQRINFSSAMLCFFLTASFFLHSRKNGKKKKCGAQKKEWVDRSTTHSAHHFEK
jgi:hypothetical protein